MWRWRWMTARHIPQPKARRVSPWSARCAGRQGASLIIIGVLLAPRRSHAVTRAAVRKPRAAVSAAAARHSSAVTSRAAALQAAAPGAAALDAAALEAAALEAAALEAAAPEAA